MISFQGSVQREIWLFNEMTNEWNTAKFRVLAFNDAASGTITDAQVIELVNDFNDGTGVRYLGGLPGLTRGNHPPVPWYLLSHCVRCVYCRHLRERRHDR